MNKKTLTIILVGILLVLLIFNQTKEMKKIENRYETAKNDPLKARIYTLDNGLKVYLTAYADAPRVQTNIAVRAGSKNDPEDATGLAHYLEHMLFKGTDIYGSLDFSAEKPMLEKIESLYEEYRSIDMDDTQNRERVFIIGNRLGLENPFPEISHGHDNLFNNEFNQEFSNHDLTADLYPDSSGTISFKTSDSDRL